MDRSVVAKWCQRGILGLVLGILVFAPLAFGSVESWAQVVVQWAVTAALALWVVKLAVERRPKLLAPPAVWAAVAFMGYAIFRYYTADVEYVARQEVLRIGVCFAVFVLVIMNLHGQNAVRAIVFTLIAMATIESVYGIYQLAAKSYTVFGYTRPDAYNGRGSGTYINPNHMAGFVELVIPLALAIALMSREPHWLRILCGYLAGVMFIGVLATLSKGGYVAMLGSLTVLGVILMARRRTWWSWAAGGAVLVAVFIGYKAMPEKLRERFADVERYVGNDAKDTRELIWDAAIGVWKEDVWLGAGPNHFDVKYRKYRDLWLQTRPERTHSDHLQILVDWGLVGAGLVALFLVVIGFGIRRCWPFLTRGGGISDNSNSTRLAMVAGGGLGLFALLIHGVVEFNLSMPANALAAAVVAGVVVLHIRFATEGFWWSLGVAGRGSVILAVTVSAWVLGCQASRRSVETWYLHKAAVQPGENAEKEQALRRATEAEPANPQTWLDLGEDLRYRSFVGADDFEPLALAAIEAFKRVTVLDPFDPYGFARQAMCLSWIGRHDEATPLILKASELDPNGKHVMAVRGWQQFQAGNLDEAAVWLGKAIAPPHRPDPLAQMFGPIVARELARKNATAAPPK
jgi:O-antigen ligase